MGLLSCWGRDVSETLGRCVLYLARVHHILPVAPVAYQVILEPGIRQFREFEPRRMHIRINSLGLFLVDKLTYGKRESVSQQHSMKIDEQWDC